jgi:hypothetical protein
MRAMKNQVLVGHVTARRISSVDFTNYVVYSTIPLDYCYVGITHVYLTELLSIQHYPDPSVGMFWDLVWLVDETHPIVFVCVRFQIITETLRMCNISTTVFRKSLEDVHVGGKFQCCLVSSFPLI